MIINSIIKNKLSFGSRKAGIIFREGARETHDTRFTKKRLPAKPRSVSDIPAFLEPSGSKEMQFLKIFLASPSAIKNSSSPTVL